MKKAARMAEMAEQILGYRVELPEEDDPMRAQIEAAFRKHRKSPGITVAQAIVLAQARKALNGDKNAAEFLQRLADGSIDVSDGPEVIRVQLRDGAGQTMEA